MCHQPALAKETQTYCWRAVAHARGGCVDPCAPLWPVALFELVEQMHAERLPAFFQLAGHFKEHKIHACTCVLNTVVCGHCDTTHLQLVGLDFASEILLGQHLEARLVR